MKSILHATTMKPVALAMMALALAVSAASATPAGESASVKPSERGDRETTRDDGSQMPVALERDIQFEAQQPSMRDMRGVQDRGWSGNDNEG